MISAGIWHNGAEHVKIRLIEGKKHNNPILVAIFDTWCPQLLSDKIPETQLLADKNPKTRDTTSNCCEQNG